LATSRAPAAERFKSKHYAIEAVTIAKGLVQPWSLAFLPDGRMLVTEKPGRLRIVTQNGKLSPPLKGVPKVDDSGQGGLLDIALDRNFKTNRTIYLSYAEPGKGGSGTAIMRAVLSDQALSRQKVIFRQMPKSRGGVHFGSRLVTAPGDLLFITIGDRGQRERVQNPKFNRGQVIRIHTDGRMPKDNPFIGKSGARPEIWSLGHRNAQGAGLHPKTGRLWTVEHGAAGGDEVNIPLAGRNYGWPVISYGRHYSGAKIGVGTHKPGLEQPIHYWDPSIAPSGLAFYTGDKFPRWRGNLFIGALRGRHLARLVLDGRKVIGQERLLAGLGERIRDVRQGPDGAIYILTDSRNGRILRLVPANGKPD
jgi:glucose/arabinose dehydrogenase